MRRARWKWLAAALVASMGAACSAILGLDPPPVPDAGALGGSGGSGSDGGGGEQAHDGATPPPPVCAPLDEDAGTVFSPLTPVTTDGGPGAWDWFDMTTVAGSLKSFAGGTFDGRYVYFAARGSSVARYDTQGSGFTSPSSWSAFNVSAAPLSITGGFVGAAFDGRYVYFIPGASGSKYLSVVARYDTQGTFTNATGWSTFDAAALSADGGAVTSGFEGAGFDGRFLYLVPHADGVADGRVVRYDTTLADAGVVTDAGDGGVTSGFTDLAHWATYDLTGLNPQASGFAGAVYDGAFLYLVPQLNNAFSNEVHGGNSGVIARYRADAGFESDASWSTFDLTNVNGLCENFLGGGFDGRYVYLAPRGQGIVARFDTKASQLGTLSAWSTYDITRVVPAADGGAVVYAGTAFDGRFVYFVPFGSNFAKVARYDTKSTFTADCAWSTADLSEIDAGGAVPQSYDGAVFDGQYLYLIPNVNGIVMRFKAKTPGSMPALPAFHGSFY